MKNLFAACGLLLLGACAWTPDSVIIQRQSVPVALVPGAAAVTVIVTAADARREREISHKKNGYGMRGADISATNDVVAEIREGVAEIISNQGFPSGQDASVRIEVARFYNIFDTGFFSATANAQATANLQVVSADGRSLYSRIYTVSHALEGVQLMTADNAGTALRDALHTLLQQIAADPNLSQALLQARPMHSAPIAQPANQPRAHPPA